MAVNITLPQFRVQLWNQSIYQCRSPPRGVQWVSAWALRDPLPICTNLHEGGCFCSALLRSKGSSLVLRATQIFQWELWCRPMALCKGTWCRECREPCHSPSWGRVLYLDTLWEWKRAQDPHMMFCYKIKLRKILSEASLVEAEQLAFVCCWITSSQ